MPFLLFAMAGDPPEPARHRRQRRGRRSLPFVALGIVAALGAGAAFLVLDHSRSERERAAALAARETLHPLGERLRFGDLLFTIESVVYAAAGEEWEWQVGIAIENPPGHEVIWTWPTDCFRLLVPAPEIEVGPVENKSVAVHPGVRRTVHPVFRTPASPDEVVLKIDWAWTERSYRKFRVFPDPRARAVSRDDFLPLVSDPR